MYEIFVFFHSIFRWLVLISLLYIIGSSIHGLISKRNYTRADSLTRALTTIISHTQLLIGFTLYFVLSPITGFFIKNGSEGNHEIWFFGIYHIALMFSSIVVMTIGGSITKRATTNYVRFKTISIYFSIALLLILAAIPWFRPFLRNF
ncbi:hypothetical protein [Emticicia sp. BO119]|uniref:hypothetical protein n=1 Tax=Emticicia sp. BO119 TaxID=2757768 RepID=UPI0015F048B3|nr:hypothetical protein [Emticicia sp. BO119]MBA4853090.1 hypothetical protein [Emticicia sp. BO119]